LPATWPDWSLVRASKSRSRKAKPWSVDEARAVLESAQKDGDPLYAAYVLILVLGLRRGEVLGLPWAEINLDGGELHISWQLQRVAGKLLHRETKTEASDAPLPLPDIHSIALTVRKAVQGKWEEKAGKAWQGRGLVLTTGHGSAIEPRNVHPEFKARCRKAGLRSVPVHTTRRTCASLLLAMDVHPRVVMQILPHSQIAVTVNAYSEVTSNETREALKRLGKSLEAE
jgi:integrase